MDPQSSNSPDLRMPPPNAGQDSLGAAGDGASISQPKFSDTTDTVIVDPNGAPHHPISTPDPSITAQDSTGMVVADDDDGRSVDEEWIQKAKAIVEQTKGDPYQQSREIGKVKANYLKTHYNKDIKIAEDQSL